MKVNMKIDQQEHRVGFFRKEISHHLAARVDFTPEERQAIERSGIKTYELFSYPASGVMVEYALEKYPHLKGRIPIHVADFLRQPQFKPPYPDVLQAQRAMAELKENLIYLKSAIEQTSAPASESFEL